MEIRKAIEIVGLVQGVGFRPHVHRLARETALAGSIANTCTGVAIEVQGPPAAVDEFLERLPREAPPLARILGIAVRAVPCVATRGFRIAPSRADTHRQALVVPDVATCDDCLRELHDPQDRRYRYPFINCTNCGPRYTIVEDIPYDRPLTAMAAFPLCPACRAEYEDPEDRRFHAQATACPACGPRLALRAADGAPVEAADPLAAAIAHLAEGAVVALKGLGGYHLAVDATSADAVRRLRARKGRVDKPFAVMVADAEAAAAFTAVDGPARALLTDATRPIVLLPRREGCLVAEEVAPGTKPLGLFLPYTPLHHLLFSEGGFAALVMTSGNRSEEPIACDDDEALARLQGLADLFLVHDRRIAVRCDDSVARVVDGCAHLVRRARGYVPVPVALPFEAPPVLAVGGELKNTVCLTRGRLAFPSQHVGDLENLETYDAFLATIAHLRRLLGVEPALVAHDLHPDYAATRWARAQDTLRPVGVQHHHAHIAACMAEHGLEGRVLGLALDGTGYGTDGAIWGCEVGVAGYEGFERAAHLAYVPLPGGDAAIREPWRMAVSFLTHHFGPAWRALPIPFVRALDGARTRIVEQMVLRGLHAPPTSSCGRLFDAVAALLGVRASVTYEAQAAIELEALLAPGTGQAGYPFALEERPDGLHIGTRPLFEAIVDDLRRGVPAGTVSRRFHDGFVTVLADVAGRVRAATGLDRVCLSGGSFQNAYLLTRLSARLRRDGFAVHAHRVVPPNDGGLALGQAAVAAVS